MITNSFSSGFWRGLICYHGSFNDFFCPYGLGKETFLEAEESRREGQGLYSRLKYILPRHLENRNTIQVKSHKSQSSKVVYDLVKQAIFSKNKIEDWNFVGYFNCFCLESDCFQIPSKKLPPPKRCVIHKKECVQYFIPFWVNETQHVNGWIFNKMVEVLKSLDCPHIMST